MKKKIKKRLDRLEAAVFGKIEPIENIYVIVGNKNDNLNLRTFIRNKYPEEFDIFTHTRFGDFKKVYFHFSESCWHYGDLVDLAPELENIMKRVTTVELLKNYL